MLKVRQCMIGETAWFRKLEGEYHYMGESHVLVYVPAPCELSERRVLT